MTGFGLSDMLTKLVASLALGGLIGLERETHGRPAGLRTHILVCIGSTLFALCSYSIAGTKFDPARVTAQIVTGIGFLGAGTIMRQGSVVRGLTTAASIWATAAIGIAVAIGEDMFYVAIVASALVFATLYAVPYLERYVLFKREERLLTILVKKDTDTVSRVLAMIGKHGGTVSVLGCEETREGTNQVLKVRIRTAGEFDESSLNSELAASDVVISYSWE